MVERNNLAVLFDADNTSKNYVKAILDACARYGRVIIKRSYGDWTAPNLQGWSSIFRELAIRPIQQFRFTSGKNITDSAMIIDAMDILHSKDVDAFVLVSSDSDFTGLATRIREEGLRVIGVGRRITPPAFVNACDEFLLLENLIGADTFEKGEVKLENVQDPAKATNIELTKEQGRELLVRAIKAAQDENGFVKGAAISLALRRIDPAFDPKSYGTSKLADFIELYPDVLELQGRRAATDPTYKSKL
ncbi:MAG: NYN domain-containing protein [Candidatus Bathyarchaeota archaeon]